MCSSVFIVLPVVFSLEVASFLSGAYALCHTNNLVMYMGTHHMKKPVQAFSALQAWGDKPGNEATCSWLPLGFLSGKSTTYKESIFQMCSFLLWLALVPGFSRKHRMDNFTFNYTYHGLVKLNIIA